MAAFEFQPKNIFFALIWFCFLLPVSCPEALSEKVELGEDAHLKCESPRGVSVEAVKWTRPDLKTLEHVFLYRDGHIETDDQHPSFKNRVELRDGEMKNGDVSLTLKNVKKKDSGTYECWIKAQKGNTKRNANDDLEPISTIRLKVVDPAGMDPQDHEDPDPEGPAGRRRVGVAVVFLLAVITAAAAAAAGFVIHRKQGAPGQDFNPVPSVIQT